MITNSQIIRKVAKRTGYFVDDVTTVLDELNNIIEEELLKGEEKIKLGSFYFESKIAEPRKARNPRTGETIYSDKHLKCLVCAGHTLKDKFRNIKFE